MSIVVVELHSDCLESKQIWNIQPKQPNFGQEASSRCFRLRMGALYMRVAVDT